jgi:hypothetical protein
METQTTHTRPGTYADPQTQAHDHSLATLIRELRDETTTLMRQEIELAKTEMSEKSSRLARNATYIAIGGLIAYAGMVVLLLAVRDLLFLAMANAGVDAEVALWVAPLVVGILVGVIGWAMISKGKKALAHEGLAPEKTMASLREDKDWAKHKFQHKHETAI